MRLEPVLSHLADVPRNPASVMKIVTTWSALEVLGPTYTWPTEVYFFGSFDGEKLDGDLALKGYGDPYLVHEELWKLLRALRRAGLEDISGDLVLDDSYFDVVEDAPGAFDGQPDRSYNVVPSALLVNFKSVSFEFRGDPGNGRVVIATDPTLNNLKIRNEVKLGDGPCGGYQAGISFNQVDEQALDEVVLGGEFSRRCPGLRDEPHGAAARHVCVRTIRKLVARSRRQAQRHSAHATVPPDLRPIMVWQSPPLGEVIRSINKNSNNVMTRQLLYTLGAGREDLPARVRRVCKPCVICSRPAASISVPSR